MRVWRFGCPCGDRAGGCAVACCRWRLRSRWGGCGLKEWANNGFKVGPNYSPPPAPVAEAWIDYQPPAATEAAGGVAVEKWWTTFGDGVLNSLISDAYNQNISLRVAGERIAEARAVRGIAVGNLFPQSQEAAGSYGAGKLSENAANAPRREWFHNTQAGINVSWEIDFWGRFRRSIEAADAAIDASIANFDDVLTLLLADVTSNYIQYRTLQERLRLTRENVRIQEASYELTLGNFRAGAVTERDVQQARQILEQTRSAIPQLEAGLRRTNNALCVLMGMAPTDLSSRLGETGSIPMGRPEWDAGIPADLLRRRPDVRRAEREVAIQSATIGITKADLYPQFFLAGSVGVQAENFGDIFSLPSSLTLFGGPGFQWNILNYGRIESAVAAQEARFRQFFSRYQAVVLRANREAEDAIIGFFKAQERVRHLSESVAAARRTYEITFDQYREGAIDFTPVFIF